MSRPFPSAYFTDRQWRVLNFVRGFILEHQFSPTLQEIARHFSVSVVTALAHLRALEKKGALRRRRSQPRSIELADDPRTQRTRSPQERPDSLEVRLPCIGAIRNGQWKADTTRPLIQLPSQCVLVRIDHADIPPLKLRDGDHLILDPKKRDPSFLLALVSGRTQILDGEKLPSSSLSTKATILGSIVGALRLLPGSRTGST